MVDLQTIHSDNLFITQTRFRDVFEKESGTEYLKKDFILAGGDWQGKTFQPLRTRVPEASVLVLGESDKEMPWLELQRIFAAGGYRTIWATHHRKRFGPRVRTLPLGVPMDRHYGFPFDILGDIEQLRSVFAKVSGPEHDSAEIMGAFSLKTHSSRARLADILEASPIGTVGDYPITPQGREGYLAKMKESGMVACPRGQGIDTYRFWEAIYMGAIPIIITPPKPYAQCIEGLPVIVVRQWSELANSSWVLSQYSKVRKSTPDFSKASLAFVVEEILRNS